MKMKKNGLFETKLFHFHRLFKNGGREGGSSEPPDPLWLRHWKRRRNASQWWADDSSTKVYADWLTFAHVRIANTAQMNKKAFCSCSMAVTSTEPDVIIVLWFYIREHPKAQSVVVLV